MSNFFYKGIAISTITKTSGSTNKAPGYSNFPVVPTNYTGLVPNDFLYYYKNPTNGTEPVSELCTASYTIVNTSTNNQSVPSGCKRFYVIAVGGGAGGYGAGGLAKGTYPPTGSVQGSGGAGGRGGSGGTTIRLYKTNSGNITIKVGNGGNAGKHGDDVSAYVPTADPTPYSISSGQGNPGNNGNSTQVFYSTEPFISGPGGIAGNYGGSAKADYDAKNYNFNSKQGADGDPGKDGGDTNPYSLNFPMGGAPGGRGGSWNQPAPYNYVDAQDGTDGFAQIIWLYD